MNSLFFSSIFLAATLSCGSVLATTEFDIQHLSREQSMLRLDDYPAYILLPVQNGAPMAQMKIIVDNKMVGEKIDIELARDRVDLYVPIALAPFKGKSVLLNIFGMPKDALCWEKIQYSESYQPDQSEIYRPLYHHSPPYGWMNDPNGMFYKDGVYHIYYQFNPYGTGWGNMHWGHSTTTDFINWKDEGAPIAPDALGMIWSGSAIVDHKNAAGFGKGAVIAFYTSADDRNQTQSIAYSLDDGKSFTKYKKNPVLTTDGTDFRDPKVIYHEASKKFIMVITIGQEIAFYSSKNLKDWDYESKFGEGYGSHAGAWECPDLVELEKEDGSTRWVLLVNTGNGGPTGGTSTQYFIGDFDGKIFRCEDEPSAIKNQDFAEDHYACVTWSNAPDKRSISTAWMSNGSYARMTPTLRFRCSNTIPRDLFLFEHEGDTFMGSRPAMELEQSRSESGKITTACELNFTLTPLADNSSFRIENELGEHVTFKLNFKEKTVTLDRSESTSCDFKGLCQAQLTAPIMGEGYTFRIFLDRSSLEFFMNDGRVMMTNLVYPSTPFNKITFDKKTTKVSDYKIYTLKKASPLQGL